MTTASRRQKIESGITADLVEEEIIAKASSSAPTLPMLELIMSRMGTGLGTSLKTKASILCEAIPEKMAYLTWSEAIEELEEFTICGIANSPDLDGNIMLCMDPGFFYAAMEYQLSGVPERGSAPKRGPSVMESRIAKLLLRVILDELSNKFAQVAEVKFKLDGVEVAHQVGPLHGAVSRCAVSRFRISLGECEGVVTVVMPISSLDPIQEVLSKMFLGEKLGGDGTWREYLLERISESSVIVRAQLQDIQVDVNTILAWKPGDVIELGVSPDAEATIVCSGIPIFYGSVGHKDSGKLAVRVNRENEAGDYEEV